MKMIFAMDRTKTNGQSSMEFMVLIILIVVALLTMQVYIKRGLQGKLREATDSIGKQYDPRNTTSDMTTTFNSDVTTVVTTDEAAEETTTTVTTNSQVEASQGSETVGPLSSPLF